MKVSINSKIVNNVCSTNRKAINEAFKQFNGKEIVITIEKKKKKRSTYQNKYYWGVVVKLVQLAIKDQWGEALSLEATHELLKQNIHYAEKVNENTGEIIKVAKSTTLDSTSEFMDYLTECKKFAKEWFNIDIPEPNEQIEIEL